MRRRFSIGVCVLLAVFGAAGCGDEEPPIDRVGVNVVEKSIFSGSWYMSRTVIDVDYEGAALGTFPGDVASDYAQDFTAMPRIRWVIDEDYLLAYRDYELTLGGDGEASEDELMGQPIAAFAIEKHFDIRRAYNPSTGEEQNTLVENDTDRHWYERQFMRVDWSQNLLPGYFGQTFDLNALFGAWKREPTSLYVQDASLFPDSWQPQFNRMGCNGEDDDSESCTETDRDFADQYDPDELYHMSFVTQETLSPGTVPDPIDGSPINWCTATLYSDSPACSTLVSYVRTSFLKVSDRRQYEPVNWVDSKFDRFGYFRLNQLTYDRSTGSPDDPAYFYTDFLNYSVNRHNIWKQWHDEDGDPVPYRDRDVRRVVWYSTPELPAHLVRPAFDVVAQWNEVFMETVRRVRGERVPQYPDVECQEDDPDGYCYCQKDPETGDVMTPTCPGHYDPFTPPDSYPEGTERPYDCWIDVPEDAEPDLEDPALADADFNGWYGARMVGDECVTVLRINDCNRATIEDNGGTTEGLTCEERGDLRYKFLSYVDQPGTGFLGIATLRGDPETGEILAGDANIGGPALDSFRTSALQTYDLINGTLDERELLTGENVRSYFENLGRVELPARPRTDFTVAMENGTRGAISEATKAEIDGRMGKALERIERLKGVEGRNNIYSDRKQNVIGTDLERRLASGPELLVAAGLDQLPDGVDGTELTESLLDRASPFRVDVVDEMRALRDSEDRLSRANVMMPNEYVDDSVQWFVNKHADWSRARLEIGLNRLLYRQTQLHELGHCMGLRHDFGSSADSEHYQPEYYAIAERFPLPDPADYDTDGTQGLAGDEQARFESELARVRSLREQAGIDGAMNSSVMEYSANWYERLQPLGSYDRAALLYAYGDVVEAYDGPARYDTPREHFTNYTGGEECREDADCPYSADGAMSDFLLDANFSADLTQRCVANPRTQGARLCSSFDDDLAEQAGDGGRVQPLSYRFCTDNRADSTLAWCNRFDEGESYRQIVKNIADDYERMYIFSAFRRYRKGFSIGGYRSALLSRRINVLQNIFQHMVYEYASNPEFRQTEGPFGFYDQFLATTDILNFYGKIMTQPNVGGYVWDDRTGTYVRGYTNPDAADADLSVPLGLGRYFYSDYQAGLTGIERIERIGSFLDKVWTIQMMTLRAWDPDYARYTRDVAFYVNFYDLFPNEIQQIFNGMIRANPQAYMPRLVCENGSAPPNCQTPRLTYLDFYRGDCSNPDTCRPSPEQTYDGLPVLDGGGSLSLQVYAAYYGLRDLPTYFDSSFQNQLFICIEGAGDCFEPDPTAVEGVDYVRYTSDYFRRTFLAWQLEEGVGVGEQKGIGFEMVKEAANYGQLLRALIKVVDADYDVTVLTPEESDGLSQIGYALPQTPPELDVELTRVNRRVVNLESFFNQIIELQRDFGIQDPRIFQ